MPVQEADQSGLVRSLRVTALDCHDDEGAGGNGEQRSHGKCREIQRVGWFFGGYLFSWHRTIIAKQAGTPLSCQRGAIGDKIQSFVDDRFAKY